MKKLSILLILLPILGCEPSADKRNEECEKICGTNRICRQKNCDISCKTDADCADDESCEGITGVKNAFPRACLRD